MLAFKNGCVVEKVRLRYKNDYVAFRRDSESYQPNFSEREYEVLNFIMEIFGRASARELSDINHTFDFWKLAFDNGTSSTGYHDKEMSVVDMIDQLESFSLSADDDIYSVYLDNGRRMIY